MQKVVNKMARETVAARNARLKAEQEAATQQLLLEYPQRFLELLQLALKENFEVQSVDPQTSAYTLYDRDESDTYEVFSNPGLASVFQSDQDLKYVQYKCQCKAERRAESERQYRLRQVALAKLNPEERKALGL